MLRIFLKYALGWGIILWLIGYVLGFVFYFIVPPAYIGWAITPIGVAVTLWVLIKKIKNADFKTYILIAIVWTALAVLLDYLMIVKMLNSASYYKLDVYFYYALTFLLPLSVGVLKKNDDGAAAPVNKIINNQ